MEPMSFEPMTVAQLFRTTFTLYRRRFWHFLGVVAVVYIPLVLLLIGADSLEVQGTVAHLTPLGLTLIMSTALTVCIGALTRSIAELYLGNPLTVAQAYGSLGSQALALAAVGILVTLAFFAGLLVFVLPAIFITVYCAVAAPCVVLEDLGPIAAMSRSRTLVQYDKAKVVWLGLILLAASFAIGYLVGRVVALSVTPLLGPSTPLTQFLSSLIGSVAMLWFWPILLISPIPLYFHLRSCEDEGLLLEEMQIRS